MGTKHIHADVIKAWADGADIDVLVGDKWKTALRPLWLRDCKYRVKPKNIVVTRMIKYVCELDDTITYDDSHPNLRLEFTPEGKLVSVELL